MSSRPAAVVILAAGEGTRMKSAIPKVLHRICGRALVHHAVAAASALQPEHLVVVVGHGRDQVKALLAEVAPTATTAVQDEQRGTGHAVACALREVPDLTGTVVVTYGDVPLLAAETLQDLVDGHVEAARAVTLLTVRRDDPGGYGRVVRDAAGDVRSIVEHKDATPDQLQIDEINCGIYAFDAARLVSALGRVGTDNAAGEQYLTDVLGLLAADGDAVGAVELADVMQTEGVNDRVQLARLHREMNHRILDRWMRDGVTVRDPLSTWVDADVTLSTDVVLEPGTLLRGATTVATGALIGPNVELLDTEVGPGARVSNTTAHLAVIGPDVKVGPYAYLRPGTELRAGSKVGTFVETKNSTVGEKAKVPHLSYVGDAHIGAGANIGAGVIVANYDGVEKHRTEVGAHSFVGSDSVLVAPVTVEDGAYVAAGSTITTRVESGELAVARGQQRNIAGWVARRRAGTRTAAAAEAARRVGDEVPGHDTEVSNSGEGEGPKR